MTGNGDGNPSGLRMLPVAEGRSPLAVHAGFVVHGPHRLGELVQRRPAGITGNQWTSALRETYDLVVAAADGTPRLAVEIGPDDLAGQRTERMKNAVARAVGLPVLRVGSPTLRAAEHGRRLVAYVLDAWTWAGGTADAWVGAGGTADAWVGPGGTADAWVGPGGTAELEADQDPPVEFRDILGRLPDGRTGAVNDLGALARAAAVEAYVEGRLADPIVRGLHVRWTDGPAEGWSWVEIRRGECLLERVTVREHRFRVAVDPGRLAEDLAALAIGERLRSWHVDPVALVRRAELRSEIRALAARRDELVSGFAFDHLWVD